MSAALGSTSTIPCPKRREHLAWIRDNLGLNDHMPASSRRPRWKSEEPLNFLDARIMRDGTWMTF